MGHMAINWKHADTDGNGLIDIFKDSEVIQQNATYVEPIHKAPMSSPVSLQLFAAQQVADIGDTIEFEVLLQNDEGGMVENAYGISFQI